MDSIEFDALFTRIKRGGVSRASAQSFELGGSQVWQACCSRWGFIQREDALALSMRLRRYPSNQRAIFSSWLHQFLRLFTPRDSQRAGKDTRSFGYAGIQSLERYGSPLHQSECSQLASLWRKGYWCRRFVVGVRRIFVRYGDSSQSKLRAGSNRQQRWLLQVQLSLDNIQQKQSKSPHKQNRGISRKEFDAGRMVGAIRNTFRYFVVAFTAWLAGISCSYGASGEVSDQAQKYRRDLIRESRLSWGLDAPIATFGAQIETESQFNPDAVSPAGAQGIAQFMPKTGTWLAGLYETVGPAEPFNPRWAMRALAQYDKYLWDRVSAPTDCHTAAKMLSSYNGGLGNVQKEEALCKDNRNCDPRLWWENVERIKGDNRSWPNWVENRGYPVSILFMREPRYVKAGWGRGLCQGEAY